jgi:hypothetical protein
MMNRLLLYAAVLVLAVRERWHMSRFNPWGIGSYGGRHRAAQGTLDALGTHGDLTRAARPQPPPNPPEPPVQ